jgi:hypothetical protein
VSLPALASARLQMRAQKKAKRKAKAERLKIKKPTHSALVKKADAMFSLRVRAIGRCMSGRSKHAGNLQCAHGFSRRYEGTRWDLSNAFCLCAGCHVYFTHRPLEWDEWLRSGLGLGPALYEQVRHRALNGGKQDMDLVLARLQSL